MKKLYISFVLLVATISVFAQTPTISMTTTLSINSQITIGLSGNTSSTPIQIDWGNGVKENFTIGNSMEFFGYPVKGSTIKIWGAGIIGLNIQSKNITALEFFDATLLESLFCKNNQITTLNLNGCSALEFVECKQNLISNLTLPSTTTLTYVDCSDNNFTLTTLPVKQGTWTDYIYFPQKDYTLAKTIYAVNEEIDLSNQFTISGNTTTYTWKTKGGITLVNGSDYNVTNGKFSFLRGNDDSLYCEMTNSLFPSLTLNTTRIAIPTPPAIVMNTENVSSIWIGLGTNADATIKADWGDGNLESLELKLYNNYYFNRSVLGKTIKLYGNRISYLQINSAGLTTIDVSNAPNLGALECTKNNLTTLDISNNIMLYKLDCSENQLTFIDVTHNSNLSNFNCSNNYLTYNNTPPKKPSWSSYTFSPQLFKLQKNAYDINETIDISHHYSINGNISVYKWKTLSGVTLTKGVDYTESSGIFTFLVANADLLVCELTNGTFPGLILKTEAITVQSSEPSIIATINNQIINSPNIEIGTSAITTIKVDWGDGSLTNYIVNSTNSQIRGTLKGSTVKIYGAGITSLKIYYCLLTALDVSKAILLKELYCYGNNLTTLDVSKNITLTKLNCDSNELTALDVSKNTALSYLECSSNHLTTLDVSNNNALFDLYCDSNQLTALDISNNTALFLFHCSSNRLTTLDLSKNTALKYLYCDLNRLTFCTLPIKQPAWSIYTYNPQLAIVLPKKTYAIYEEIDLSSQLMINGKPTIYVWRTSGGLTLIKDIDYTESNGKFTFLRNCSDYFYCQMSNAEFPDLTLLTEPISIPSTAPVITISTTVIIGNSFSFKIGGTINNNPIQIDWGNGILENLTISSNNTLQKNLVGSTIKLYGTGISYLDCSLKSITSINVANCASLQTLNCSTNNISALDVTKNTALATLNCKSNLLNFSTLPIKQPDWTEYTYSPQKKLPLPKKNYDLNEEIDLCSQLSVNGNTTNYTWKTIGGITLTIGTDYNANNGKFNFLNKVTDSIYCEMTNATFPNLTLYSTAIALPKDPILTITTTNAIGSYFSFTIRAKTTNTPAWVDWGDGILSNYNITTSNSIVTGTLKANTIKVYGTGIHYMDVSSKNLTSIDASNNSALQYFFCGGNQLTTLDVSKNTELIRLNFTNNKLTTIDVTKNIALIYLDCYNNKLTSIDISKNIALTLIDCYSNQLTALDVSKNTALTYIDCKSNLFNFVSLPIKQTGWTTYTYSPQATLVLIKKNYTLSENIALSSQLTVNGNTTNYIWKTKGGLTLTAGTDYTTTNGVTTFLRVQTDSVYCQMTNATFPSLTLSTTNVKITQFPSSVDEITLNGKVFPNPIKESLNIELSESISKVEVYSVIGAKIFEKVGNNSNTLVLPTIDFPRGILIVKVYSRNGVVEKKVLKE